MPGCNRREIDEKKSRLICELIRKVLQITRFKRKFKENPEKYFTSRKFFITFKSHRDISDFIDLYDLGFKSWKFKCWKKKEKEEKLEDSILVNIENLDKEESIKMIEVPTRLDPEKQENRGSKLPNLGGDRIVIERAQQGSKVHIE